MSGIWNVLSPQCVQIQMLTRVVVTAVMPWELQFYDNAGVIAHLTPPRLNMDISLCCDQCIARSDQETNHRHESELSGQKTMAVSHQTSTLTANEQIMKANDLCQPINALKGEWMVELSNVSTALYLASLVFKRRFKSWPNFCVNDVWRPRQK